MSTLFWTDRAQEDLAAIRAFIETDSPHYADVVARRLIHSTDRLQDFLQSGRAVPEYSDPSIREVIRRPYRIVYRIVSDGEVHVLTIHHGARGAVELF